MDMTLCRMFDERLFDRLSKRLGWRLDERIRERFGEWLDKCWGLLRG